MRIQAYGEYDEKKSIVPNLITTEVNGPGNFVKFIDGF